MTPTAIIVGPCTARTHELCDRWAHARVVALIVWNRATGRVLVRTSLGSARWVNASDIEIRPKGDGQ